MLFIAKATALALLALQVNAHPLSKNSNNNGVIFVDEYIVKNATTTNPHLEERQGGGVDVGGLISAGIDAASKALDLVEKKHLQDMAAREIFMKDTMRSLAEQCPQDQGFHSFGFIRYKGFDYKIDNPSEMVDYSIPYKRKDAPDTHEEFRFVAFKGHGVLHKNGYDGGWANWAYSNDGQRDNLEQGDTVEWW